MDVAYDIGRFKRSSVRKKYETEVSFSAGVMCLSAMLENISMGGALLASKGLPFIKPGREITINIPFAVKPGSVKRKAIVMWADNDHFGVQFV